MISKGTIAYDPAEDVEQVQQSLLGDAPKDDRSKGLRRPDEAKRAQTALFASLAVGSIISALGFSALQEHVFNIPGFTYGGWMTFITYITYAVCGLADSVITGQTTRQGRLLDYALVAMLAMAGQYFTNWALNYVNYTTKIVFKSCKVLPVMLFRMLIIGQRYNAAQYGAGLLLVAGIVLFTLGDADGAPQFQGMGVCLMLLSLICDPLTANLEERQFFRIKSPAGHAEVMLYLSLFAGVWSLMVITATGELWQGFAHSLEHTATVPFICAFSVLGYVTVSLVLLLIKNFGATNAEIVKSMRKVCQVAVSLSVFPKPLTWKYFVGGTMVTLALYVLQRVGRQQKDVIGTAPSSSERSVAANTTGT